jgi:hypothetical protein
VANPKARVRQEAAEIIVSPFTTCRVDQETIEIVDKPANPLGLAAQLDVDVLDFPSTPVGRGNQVAVEILVPVPPC